MLVINDKQLGIFKTAAEARFESDLVLYIRTHQEGTVVQLPWGPATVEKLPASTLLTLVRTGVEQARKYGITGQSAIAGYLTIMFETAPNFDADRFLQRFLTDSDVEPNSRIDHLLERASEEDWAAVKEAYDPSAWELETETDSSGGLEHKS